MLPSVGGLIAALITAGIGASVLFFWTLLRPTVTGTAVGPPGRFAEWIRPWRSPAARWRLAFAGLAGTGTLAVTRWPVAAIGIAVLVAGWSQLFGGAGAERAQIATLDALVLWTEALRDTVTARASLEQAIPATALHAAPAIRPALHRLVGQLRARVPLGEALLGLSADFDDASADKVIGALILSSRQRGTGLGTVLGALAAAGRAELDQRRRISAGRAGMRRSVQLVVVITVGFAGFLATFSRPYVAPYGSVAGQVALTVVIALFAVGFGWLRRLAGGDPTPPFLQPPDTARAVEDRRLLAHLSGLTATGHPVPQVGGVR